MYELNRIKEKIFKIKVWNKILFWIFTYLAIIKYKILF